MPVGGKLRCASFGINSTNSLVVVDTPTGIYELEEGIE